MSRRDGCRRRASSGLVAVVAGLIGAGCGGGDGSAPPVQQGPRLAEPINFADCTDWNEGSVEERLGTIREIREFFGGPVPGTGGTGAVLEDEQAIDLFDGYCANHYARGFKLYKLYGRAAAFSGQ